MRTLCSNPGQVHVINSPCVRRSTQMGVDKSNSSKCVTKIITLYLPVWPTSSLSTAATTILQFFTDALRQVPNDNNFSQNIVWNTAKQLVIWSEHFLDLTGSWNKLHVSSSLETQSDKYIVTGYNNACIFKIWKGFRLLTIPRLSTFWKYLYCVLHYQVTWKPDGVCRETEMSHETSKATPILWKAQALHMKWATLNMF